MIGTSHMNGKRFYVESSPMGTGCVFVVDTLGVYRDRLYHVAADAQVTIEWLNSADVDGRLSIGDADGDDWRGSMVKVR